MNGSIVDILVNLSGTCNQLPQEGTCEEVVFVKLKKNYFLKAVYILSQFDHRVSELH